MEIRTKAHDTDKETALELANREIAYRAALEGIVLLENHGCLPIAPGRVALYGAGAGMTIKGGTGSGEVNERHSVTILEGLEKAGYTVTTRKWIEDYERDFRAGEAAWRRDAKRRTRGLNMKRIVEVMANPFRYPVGRPISDEDLRESATDTCVYVIARQAGEGMDRRLDNHDYDLQAEELANLRKCAASYKKLVVVVNSGSTMDLGFLDDIKGIGALLFFCQQGCEGGRAFADLLSGKAGPSGRLVDTWPRKYGDIPFGGEYSSLGGDAEHARYREGIFVGYRYFDSYGVEPRYEFGYGLGYTGFGIESLGARVEGSRVTVRARVTNTGKERAGREVVQLYASAPRGRLPKEAQSLAAFAKTGELKPGTSEELELSFDLSALASYSEEEASFILEKGDYVLRLGHSSRKTRPCAVLALGSEAVISRHRNLLTPTERLDGLPPPPATGTEDLQGIPRLAVDAAAFRAITHNYDLPSVHSSPSVDAVMARLSRGDMVDLVVGAGMFAGKTHYTVPGAVGYTTSRLVGKGLPNAALADGPAGLRIQRVSCVTKRGAAKMKRGEGGFIGDLLPGFLAPFMYGDEKRDRLVYQYATSFPVELAIAQSWNLPLVEEIGRAVGDEMEEYGVTWWLAPGINIHRNPLCGRNFEYYSEDPLLTGKVAAAITRGAQARKGRYVTIKHYCANNQESNRFGVSSDVSERALREIYLRGFELAVREGGAKAVMSSYNKVNGVPTANSHDLLTKILRNEWGFEGIVMTDWFSTVQGCADSGLAIAAGNDLLMPGTGKDKKRILARLRDGSIKEEDLRRCAANLVRDILAGGGLV